MLSCYILIYVFLDNNINEKNWLNFIENIRVFNIFSLKSFIFINLNCFVWLLFCKIIDKCKNIVDSLLL